MFATSVLWFEPQDIQWIIMPIILLIVLGIQTFQRKVLIITPWSLLCIVFGAWMLVRLDATMEWAPHITIVVLTIWILALIVPRETYPKWIWIPLVSALLFWNLSYLVCQFLGKDSFYYLHFPFNQRNHFQMFNYLAAGALLLIVARDGWGGKFEKLVVVGSFGIIIWLLATVGAKNVPLGAIIAFVLFLIRLALRKRSGKISIRVAIIVGVVCSILIMVVVPIWTTYLPPLNRLGISFTSRQTIWQATWNLIRDHWALGAGSGAYRGFIRDYWPLLKNAAYPSSMYPGGAHNQALFFWAETGLPGCIFWIALFGGAMGISFQQWVASRSLCSKMLFPFLVGYSIIVSLTFTPQWHTSSFIAALFVPGLVWNSAIQKKWIFPQFRLQIIPMLIVLVFFLLASYPNYQSLKSDHMIHYISLTQKVSGGADLDKLSEANRVWPNSVSLYYGSKLLIEANQLADAKILVEQLEKISWHRWPVERLRAEIFYRNLQCNDGDHEINHYLQVRIPEEEAYIKMVRNACFEKMKIKDVR